jgi:hypothetical protein
MPTAFTLERFVDRLIDAKRPTLSAASWRQVRAATVYGLKVEAVANPALSERVEVAIARLKSARPAKAATRPLRTSQQKAKRFLPGDLDRIGHAAGVGSAHSGKLLAAYLPASNITGLRPIEWLTAEFRRSKVPGFDWELIVRNGKADDVRAHGEFRTLRWTKLSEADVSTITGWIAHVRQTESVHAYRTLVATMRSRMRTLTKRLYPRRRKRPTLYTPRHEAAARWKSFYVDTASDKEARIHGLAIVAALLGHASDATATCHYGRPHKGERSSQLPAPVADPAEVARVRQRLHRSLARLANRRPPQGYQP